MIKYTITTLLLLFGLSANAHFEIGTYEGKTFTGDKCQFTIHGVSFKNDTHHPLNEMVEVTLGFLDDKKVVMSHIPLVDNVKKTVRPKPEVLSAVWATETGAESVELIMNHDGPVQMIHITDHYKTPANNLHNVCMQLQYRGN